MGWCRDGTSACRLVVSVSSRMSLRTTYTASAEPDEPAIPRAMMPLRLQFDHAFDGVDELSQLLPQTCRGNAERHPAPMPQRILEPVVAHVGDAHHVHINATPALAVGGEIAADRP